MSASPAELVPASALDQPARPQQGQGTVVGTGGPP